MSKSVLISIVLLAIISSGCISRNDTDKTTAQDSEQTQQLQSAYETKEILFVGMIGKKAGLYKYDLYAKIYSEFWQSEKEEVVELSYSTDKRSAFLLTAHQSGKKGVFPFVDNVKLYSINLDSGSVKFTASIGSGLQVYSFWPADTSFKIILNIINATVAKYVDQQIKTFDATGRKLSDEKILYDLGKEGYPQFPMVQKKLTSSDKKYSIMSVDSVQTLIYIIDHTKNDEKVLITKLNQKLNFVDWSDDGKFLVFNTIDITPGNETLYDMEPSTSKLFIFSVADKKTIKIYEGGGIKNYILTGNYLLFDDGFKEKSKIFIYNLQSNMITDSINVTGGCGLRNIPTIPDYEA